MKRSSVRLGTAVVVVLIAGGVAGLELRDGLGMDESAETQIRKLESFWPSRRRSAATELARFTSEADKVVPILVKALGDSDSDVRLNALESLKSYGERAKAAGPLVSEKVKNDPDERARQRAAALLGVIKDPDTIPILVEALDDRDSAVQLEATRSLARFGRGASSGPLLDKLVSALSPEHPVGLRDASVEALDALGRDQERVARAIADVAASDPSPDVRYKAVGVTKTPVFEFQLPALIRALEDPSPRVRLIAGSNLAWIGLTDKRVVPALCKAALQADAVTREGIGSNINLLMLDRSNDKKPPEQVTPMYQTAVREFRRVLETRDAAAREQVLNVLGRLVAVYLKTSRATLLEPARSAVEAILARMEDENEEVPIRLLAMEQWAVVNLLKPSRAGTPLSAAAVTDDFHPTALWIEAMCKQLMSPSPEVRSRAGEILVGNFEDRDSDPSFRAAWQKSVPSLAMATQTDDVKVRNGAVTILRMLGPAAGGALPALRSLADHTGDASLKSAAESAIKSISSVDDLKASDPSVRAAGAAVLGRLGWPATAAVPAVANLLRDPENEVRLAAAQALKALGAVSKDAVPELAAALAGEPAAAVRVMIVEALEAIEPGAPPVVDAHLLALRDSSPDVRKAGASFHTTPADDTVVSALETALGDPDEGVRLKVATDLTGALFENPTIVPALLKGLGNNAQRKTILKAVSAYLENNSDAAVFARVRSRVPACKAALNSAIPALSDALSAKDQETSALVYGLLGRIVSFSGLTRDEELRKAVGPALQIYLKGLEESDPAVRQEVVGRLETLPIGQKDVVAALQKFLDRSDIPADERQTAVAALEVQSAPPGADTASKSSRSIAPGAAGKMRLRD